MKEILSAINGEAACVIGDINCVRNEKERCNCEYRERDSMMFNRFIKNLKLKELVSEDKFTWFDNQGRKSRLDRFLVNAEWSASGKWEVKMGNRKHSDHKPLFLSNQEHSWVPKPFKIFNWWWKGASFTKDLEGFWEKMRLKNNMPLQDLLKAARGYKELE